MRGWLLEKYGNVCTSDWFQALPAAPVVLDAGCGAALSALALFEEALDRIRYIGVDISNAVDVARARFGERGFDAGVRQSDLQRMPFNTEVEDITFSARKTVLWGRSV